MSSLAVKGNTNRQHSPAWGDSRGHRSAVPVARRHLAVCTMSCTLIKFKTKIQFLAGSRLCSLPTQPVGYAGGTCPGSAR